MKKAAFLFISNCIILFTISDSYAQTPGTAGDSKIVITTSEGKGLVDISSADEGDKMVIRIASMEIVMNTGKSADTPTRHVADRGSRPSRVAFGSSNYQSFFELGFNSLPCPNYSMYSSLPDGAYDFMDLRNAKSLQFAFSLGDITLYLNHQRNLAFTTAFQIVFDEYVFSNSIRLVKQNGMLIPEAISPTYKKSKLTTTSLRIPLLLTVGRSGSFHFSLGVYGGVRIGNHAKIKFPKEKTYDMYMAPFYGGMTARAGFRGLYVYSNYDLSDMFKRGKGPSVSPLTIGLGLWF